MTASNAERQARHRLRQAEEREALEAQAQANARALEVILAAVNGLGGQVQTLAKAVDNLSRRVDKRYVTPAVDSVDSAPLRNGGGRTRARARETVAPAPYGGLGATPYVVEEDAWLVCKAMAGHGPVSVGALRDHLDTLGHYLDLGRITAALVHLQSRGEASREAGDALTGRPDTWRLIDPETPAAVGAPPTPMAANRQDSPPPVTH